MTETKPRTPDLQPGPGWQAHEKGVTTHGGKSADAVDPAGRPTDERQQTETAAARTEAKSGEAGSSQPEG